MTPLSNRAERFTTTGESTLLAQRWGRWASAADQEPMPAAVMGAMTEQAEAGTRW